MSSLNVAQDEAQPLPPASLTLRDAFSDFAAVASRLVHDGSVDAANSPRLTIGIPTFRRLSLLVEAVRSAAAQCCDGGFEIVIVDNDPDSRDCEAMFAAAPDLRSAPIRYFVNAANIGMFGNWNRCVELARGEWVTVLNDDDLLHAKFAERMLTLLGEAPEAWDGLICRKQTFDERPGADEGSMHSGLRARVAHVVRSLLFAGRKTRRIGARQLFWGNLLGNCVGFVCRTAQMREIGGFYPENYPSADYYFYTRFAGHLRLGQTREILASIRVAENESARPEVLYGFLKTGYQLQQALAGTQLPRWWRRISPWLIARHVGELSEGWNVPLDRQVVERSLGIALPADHKRGMMMLRAALRGF